MSYASCFASAQMITDGRVSIATHNGNFAAKLVLDLSGLDCIRAMLTDDLVKLFGGVSAVCGQASD